MFSQMTIAGFVAILLIAPANAIEVQPGLWQDNEVTEVNGQAQKPQVKTDCIRPEDAKDPVKAAKAAMKDVDTKQCRKYDIKQSGNQFIIDMDCGDPKEGTMKMSVVWTIIDAQHTTSVAKSEMSFGGQKMSSSLKTDSKWISATCKN